MMSGEVSPKSRFITALLAFFLGVFGVHRFYIGRNKSALVMLVLGFLGCSTVVLFGMGLFILSVVEVWVFIDIVVVLVGAMKDGEGRVIKKW